MRVDYLSQPFPPEDQHLGSQLRSLLSESEGRFDSFTAFVAFVKFSGVSRLFSSLQAYKDAGGESTIVAGIDQKGTTRQGLEYLRKVVTQVFIYHDESQQRRTFHPKFYIFEQSGVRAIVLLGSGNLTAGGLFTNYESHLRLEFDLQSGDDQKSYERLWENCQHFLDTDSPCIRELDDELFALISTGLPDESQTQQENPSQSETEDEATPPAENEDAHLSAGIFGSSKFSTAPKPDITLGITRAKRRHETQPVTGAAIAIAAPAIAAESGFWKVLSSFDVNPKSAPGQILIPKEFRDFFNPLKLTKAAGAAGKGRQWESSFAVHFRDRSFTAAGDARFIVYEPKIGHKRKNTEPRFTFHNRQIFKRLKEDDMLVFRSSSDTPVKFLIERLSPRDKDYQLSYRGTGRRWGRL